MRAEDRVFADSIRRRLRAYSKTNAPLPGISSTAELETLIFQIIESIRRIRFVSAVAARPISEARLDPRSDLFDPVRAAILRHQRGEFEEACWLVFLFTHFGKNVKSGYQLIRDVYGRLGQRGKWDWETTSVDTFGFKQWLDQHSAALKSDRTTHRGFGNHRKYQSLDAWTNSGTGSAVESYVEWVLGAGGHEELFSRALAVSNGDGQQAFRLLYIQMGVVKSFGRVGKFDYLSMIGKTGIQPIEPNSVCFQSATGPVTGARLLFRGSKTADASQSTLERSADDLADALGIGKQAMEDSLCNWQKSPAIPVRFRG